MKQCSIAEKLVRFPAELLLMQSSVESGLFPYSHNDGTWFLSCLSVSYFLFPIFTCLIRTDKRTLIRVLVVVYILCSMLPVLVTFYSLPNVYSNAVLRCLQFLGGMILAKQLENAKRIPREGWCVLTTCIILLVTAISKFVQLEYSLGQYVSYGFITFPLFMAIIYSVVCMEINEKPVHGFLKLSQLSVFCYSIFMAQFFVFSITPLLTERFQCYSNGGRLLFASGICSVITLGLHFLIEVPCSKMFRRLMRQD